MATNSVQPPPGAGGPVGVIPNAHNAWGQFRWAVNHSLPTSLARSQAIRRAARRKLRRRGR